MTWSRRKSGLYVQQALAEFEPDKHHPNISPPVQYRRYRYKLMVDYLLGFGGGGVARENEPNDVTSYALDGTNDYLSIPDHVVTSNSNWTIELQARFASVTGSKALVHQRVDSNNRFSLFFDGTNGARMTTQTGGSADVSFNQGATTGWAINTWYEIMLVKNGNDYDIYRDGTSVANVTDADALTQHSAIFTIGEEIGNTISFSGHIDEVRFSNIARETGNYTPNGAGYNRDANALTLIHCGEPILSGTTGSGATFAESSSNARVITEVNDAIRDLGEFQF